MTEELKEYRWRSTGIPVFARQLEDDFHREDGSTAGFAGEWQVRDPEIGNVIGYWSAGHFHEVFRKPTLAEMEDTDHVD